MNNNTIKIKVKQRLNKLASNDYDNIMDWQIVEAFNKAQSNWCRRNLLGTNVSKIGDEGNKRRIDDLQVLLTDLALNLDRKELYYVYPKLPADYFEWKSISANAKNKCCPARPLMIYLAEEANIEQLLRDNHKKPSFDWSETFCTMAGNKIKIFTNGEFDIEKATLTYYKQPRRIEFKGASDPYTETISTVDVECEFKDDLVELFIDECVKIISGDLEDVNAGQIAETSVETNN